MHEILVVNIPEIDSLNRLLIYELCGQGYVCGQFYCGQLEWFMSSSKTANRWFIFVVLLILA